MSYHLIRAGINLYAILKNLEDLIELDSSCQELIANKNLTIQFIVKNGPKAWVRFKDQKCQVGQGKATKAQVKLWFSSPEHLNKMFDGKANPVPLKGFTKLGFLTKEFGEITNRLEYYLKPEEVKDPDSGYVAMNTRFTLTVAAFSLSEIARYDKAAAMTASHIPNGKIQMKVLPDGPAVYLEVNKGQIKANKGVCEKPDALMEMKDIQTANDFLNGKSNPFLAIASGDVIIWGQTPMLDNLSLVLDKVQNYVS